VPTFEAAFVLALPLCHIFLSSAKACAITMGSGTCRHISTFTGFDHRHPCAAAGSVLPHQRLRQPDS